MLVSSREQLSDLSDDLVMKVMVVIYRVVLSTEDLP
jgi:hypothetical protein